MSNTCEAAAGAAATRLARLVDALEILAGRWRRETRDSAVARILHARLGGAADELVRTRDAVARLRAGSPDVRRPHSDQDLTRLWAVLDDLADLAGALPAPMEPRAPVDIRSRARAVRLETQARKLFRRLSKIIAISAAGALGAAALSVTQVAAADCVGVDVVVCTGDITGGVLEGAPVTTLTVQAVTTNATPPAGTAGVELNGDGGDGGDGADHTLSDGDDADDGASGATLVLTVAAGGHVITTSGGDAYGVYAHANGGDGGTGGDSDDIDAQGGDGGVGGDGGSVTITTASGIIITSGQNAHGVFGLAAAGNGGDGGDAAGLNADGGDGARGGVGGSVFISNAAAITTSGNHAQGIFGQSVGGRGGSGGNGSGLVGGGGDGATTSDGGSVTITNSGIIITSGSNAAGVFGQSIGGFGGSGGSGAGLFAYGGDGTTAGAGGAVSAANQGSIHTTGVRAFGVFGQSIGGGGGAGGDGGGLVALGSDGSAGGSGGTVHVENGGVILTEGDGSIGLYGQSIGGGGGDGGSGSGLVGIGGGGSGTSNGGAVSASNSGTITTLGFGAQGILVQSVGGGGGNGGAGAGLFSLGGDGGGGGEGDDVTLTNSGHVVTHGLDSAAVFAQSVGGGGGNGGGGDGWLAIGGDGAGGGAGGAVTVTNSGVLETFGDGSNGVFAQSVGGGGGNGGDASSGGLFVSLAIGGAGGTGSEGGEVTVTNTGSILTRGHQAAAVYAQSVGGGGGNGGVTQSAAIGVFGSVGISVGGDGGGGGPGGDVIVTTGGSLTTLGDDSRGVFAQSVGGGGGNGGYAQSASLALGEGLAVAGSVSVGGTGGDGGDGGSVTINHAASMTINTSGARSAGIFAQSVGGGGGNGGWSGSVAVAASAGVGGSVGVSVGGDGGGGGVGGDVTVNTTGTIHTRGVDSSALFVQSVGGGGGTGGYAWTGSAALASSGAFAGGVGVGGAGGGGGDAGDVTITTGGVIITEGDRSSGVFAQAVGGGGGTGGWTGTLALAGSDVAGAVGVSIGGSGGTGGEGGLVTVTSGANVTTLGVDAHGVFAQSIGGGGGAGGFSLAGGGAAGSTAGGGGVSVGGSGAGGGDGDIVVVSVQGAIQTYGDRSAGVYAQSVGGGGGDGGWSGALGVGAGSTAGGAAVSVGGSAGLGGDGKAVTVTSTSSVSTHGLDASGLLAQSVGGGGGTGGFSLSAGVGAGKSAGNASVGIGGGGGAGGSADTVRVTSSGQISTVGDRSYGIQAQSIGGGGGSGGFAGALSAAFSSGTPVGVGVSVGGTGGDGGDGGDVFVVSTGGASTNGADAHALFAQSVGGGGGSGGLSISGALTAGKNTVGASVAIGGDGGVGGNGGAVSLSAQGLTVTRGDRSYGVFAQSIGGGGGDGGFAGSLSGGLGSKDSFSLGFTLGGKGGAGGTGGDVTVTNGGQVLTFGADAYGVFAQSVGGGGGTGGMAVSATLGGAKSTNLSIALGGDGGVGNASGVVTVTSTNRIETHGMNAIGVFAQSIGGGGGAGGAAGALAISGGDSTNFSGNLGGKGGAGAVGGDVTVVNSGIITTSGELAYGIFAESIGGGGGHGGMAGIDENQWSEYLAGGAGAVSFGSKSNNLSLALGGDGGVAADGGDVHVTNSGAMLTTGAQASVIFAQSVGGGGGDAGVATSASGSVGAGKNGDYAFAMGGTGGVAGDAGNVTVSNTGQLWSLGDGAAGVTAQSVGGGGGSGGDARGYSMAYSQKEGDDEATSVNISIGGNGGAAGDGGMVTVSNTGQIVTEGAFSFGIFAQSVGGGGGFGGRVSTQGAEIATFLELANKGEAKGGQVAIGGDGAGGGDGGAVLVTNGGLIQTSGGGAHGVFAQSVGGGGGDGGSGLAGDLSIGGAGGVAGDGGAVTVSNTGTITTFGDLARGIFAQSIGGGGGNGGATDYDGDATYSYHQDLSDALTVVNGVLAAKDLVESFKEPDWGIGIGGKGGAAGNGGRVTVTNAGAIRTWGDSSHGIFAQSVGGGGGTGGEGTITTVGQIAFSGVGGSAGDGGDVVVTNTGLIQTTGFGAYGIFAQSVGGGGGVAGDTSLGIASWGDLTVFGGEDYSDYGSLKINPLDESNGKGGNVTVVNTGDIVLLGDGSVGIFAQSVGGGGGIFGSGIGLSFAGSLGGHGGSGVVTVTQTGNVIATGKNGVGAFFQSHAGDAAGDAARNIVATINGDVRGGAVYGKGVLIDGGAVNTINLLGVVSSISNAAIVGTFGDDTINSRKGVIGNVDLGLGANAFNNASTSTFQTLDFVKLNGGLLTNDGVLTPGGLGTVQTTRVEGGLKQSSGATFLTDLDLHRTGLSGEIDRLNVTGAATVKGGFVLNILNAGYVLPGDHTAVIINSVGTMTTSDLVLTAPTSAVAGFSLVTDAHNLKLNYVVDFSPAGFNANRTAVGDYINAIQTAGSSPDFAPIAALLFFEPSPAALAGYYDSFSPEAYGDQAAATSFASERFADSMMSCPAAPGQPYGSDNGCFWSRISTRGLTLDATGQDQAYRERASGLSLGAEFVPAEGWRLGFAASAEDVATGLGRYVGGDGGRYQGGVVVKRIAGPFTLALAGNYGDSEVDTSRYITLPGGGLRQARATQKMTFQALTARASWRLGDDSLYLRPMVEVSQTRVSTDGVTETGAGALNLVIPGQSSESTRVSFKVELGGETDKGAASARPYARIGVSSLAAGAESPFTAGFQSAPGGVNPFDVHTRLDKTTLDTELGVSVVSERGSARLGWSGQFGDRVSSQTFSVKLTLAF